MGLPTSSTLIPDIKSRNREFLRSSALNSLPPKRFELHLGLVAKRWLAPVGDEPLAIPGHQHDLRLGPLAPGLDGDPALGAKDEPGGLGDLGGGVAIGAVLAGLAVDPVMSILPFPTGAEHHHLGGALRWQRSGPHGTDDADSNVDGLIGNRTE